MALGAARSSLLLTAPWFVAVGLISHGEFFRFAVGNQVINRVASGMEEHGGFPGYYVADLAGDVLPLVGAACPRRCWRRGPGGGTQPAFGFLLGWVVGPLILLECVRTKLVHYYLPAYPACALLAAWLVLEVVKRRGQPEALAAGPAGARPAGRGRHRRDPSR